MLPERQQCDFCDSLRCFYYDEALVECVGVDAHISVQSESFSRGCTVFQNLPL